MKAATTIVIALVLAAGATGCIYITMDINLKVDRRLDDFFAFEDELDPNAGGAQ